MTKEESDEDLVARVAHGDAAAFARLVVRHRKRLTAMITRIVGPSAAEDIVQETFTRAWVHAPTWKSPTWKSPTWKSPTWKSPAWPLAGLKPTADRPSYAAWLSRVAANLALDQVRRRPSVSIDAVPDMPDPSCDAETALIRRERLGRLRTAIGYLPDRQRMALSLTYDAELANADAAVAMGISVGALELLLVRARRTLRATLHEKVKS